MSEIKADRGVPLEGVETPLTPKQLRKNQKDRSQELKLDVGVKQFEVELDGSAWPDGTELVVELEISEDNGQTWVPHSSITTSKALLLEGKCSLGIGFERGNQNSKLKVRHVIEARTGDCGLVGLTRLK